MPVRVIEDQHGPNLVLIEAGQEAVVCGEIVTAFFSFRALPAEVHANPAKAGSRQHLHFTRPGIGEMDIHAQPSGHAWAGQATSGKGDIKCSE